MLPNHQYSRLDAMSVRKNLFVIRDLINPGGRTQPVMAKKSFLLDRRSQFRSFQCERSTVVSVRGGD